MSLTRQQAEFTLSKMKEVVAENDNYTLVRKSYHDGFPEYLQQGKEALRARERIS